MDFLRRLGILVGFLFGWLIFSIALPWVFAFIGGAILGAAIWHMVKEGKRHRPGMQFSIFGGVTMLLSLTSWIFLMGGLRSHDRMVAEPEARAAVHEGAEPEAKEDTGEPAK